jgi:AraC-like DNA-binding protein
LARAPEGLLLGRNLLPMVAVARRSGFGDEPLRRAGIEPERLAALDHMVPSSRIYAFIEALLPLVELERYAVEVATATSASDFGLVGLAIRAAPTARDGLGLFIRYQRLVNTVAGFHLLEDDGELTLAEDRSGPDGIGRLVAAEISALTVVHWGRLLLGGSFAPLRIALPRGGSFARYAAWAGCPVAGGAVRASVTLAARSLDARVVTADPELWRFFGDALAEQAGATTTTAAMPLVHQLRRALAGRLCDGAPSLAEMARRLGESPRTLQRRLAEAGLRYSGVLDGLRHELAVAQLAKGELAIAEIAFALGFDEVASFHRAFRRWERTTPAAFRAAARRDVPGALTS